MKKLLPSIAILCSIASYGQQITPPTSLEKYRVSQEEVNAKKQAHTGSADRSSVSLYVDYPAADEIEQGIGASTNFLWAFNSSYSAASDTDIVPINFIGVRLLQLIGYTDALQAPIETYTGPYPYPNSLQVTVDSIFMLLSHENNSGLENKLHIDLRKLSAAGAFSNTQPTVWSDSIITTTSLSSSGNWLGAGALYSLAIPVGYTTALNEKIGIGLRYTAPKSDTLGIVASFVSNPNGPAAPDDFAMKSKFPYSVVRWEGFSGGNFVSTGSIFYNFAVGQTDTSYFKAQNWQIWALVTFTDVTGIKEQVKIPLNAGQNQPNPFNSLSQFRYSINASQTLSLVTYDINGRQVSRNDLGFKTQGEYQAALSADGLADGTYFYRLEGSEGNSTMNKMVIVH